MNKFILLDPYLLVTHMVGRTFLRQFN